MYKHFIIENKKITPTKPVLIDQPANKLNRLNCETVLKKIVFVSKKLLFWIKQSANFYKINIYIIQFARSLTIIYHWIMCKCVAGNVACWLVPFANLNFFKSSNISYQNFWKQKVFCVVGIFFFSDAFLYFFLFKFKYSFLIGF
jgi:hypothetical protein